MKLAKCQRGLSLIELMIAITIGLVLLAGILQIAVKSKSNYRVHEALSRTQETGRFALDIMARDIRMADFWGCAQNVTKITNNLNPLGTGYSSALSFSGGLSGTDGTSGQPDTITLAGASGSGIHVKTPYMPNTSAMIHTISGTGLEQGDIVLLSDCIQGDIFQITNSNPSSSGSVVHNTGSAVNPGNYNPGACGGGGNSHCLSKTYEGDAQIYAMQALTYSINHPALEEPKLVRSKNGQTAVELVAGVENMQFTYGEDTDGDGVVNIYRDATNVSNWDEVLAVKIALLVRSREQVLPEAQTYSFNGVDNITATDLRIRREFTLTITLRNRTS